MRKNQKWPAPKSLSENGKNGHFLTKNRLLGIFSVKKVHFLTDFVEKMKNLIFLKFKADKNGSFKKKKPLLSKSESGQKNPDIKISAKNQHIFSRIISLSDYFTFRAKQSLFSKI